MTIAAKIPLSSLEGWSVTGWSATFELVTLNLMNFVVPSMEQGESYYRTLCGFARPSRIKFSDFTARNDAMVQSIKVSPQSKGLKTYRLQFKNNAFIEILARDWSVIQW